MVHWGLPFVSYLLATSSPTTNEPPALSVMNLSCSHDGGSTYQLKDVTYNMPKYAKVGLVGRNGCGKSTMLSIIEYCTRRNNSVNNSQDDERTKLPYYSGEISTAKGSRVCFVEQEPFQGIKEIEVLAGDALFGITSIKKDSTNKSQNQTPYQAVRLYRQAILNAEGNPDRLAIANELMDEVEGAWNLFAKADELMTRLDVKRLESTPVIKLSGGERKRLALAAALVQEPEVLLLDEPTNHLDLIAIQWLTDLVSDKKLSVLTVTHDRAFLDSVCTQIIELDRGNLYSYEGTYADFLEQKELRLAAEDQAVASAKNKYRTELDWMRRQPQARETKQKARIDAFYKLEKAIKPRQAEANLAIDKGNRRIGKNILKCTDISLKFGDQIILDKFSYSFNRGDRIGVVGGNGVGKSTFLKVLIGEQLPDSGDISVGETVVFGIYDQMGIQIDDEDQRLIDYVKERVEDGSGSSIAESPAEARRLLNKFEFPSNRWDTRVSLLSGGERRRLQLLNVLTKKPNFLILDEPTNDVDLDTLGALENFISEYDGVLVVVTHDRYFADKVCDHLFVFEGNGSVKDYLGTLSEYSECLVYDSQKNSAVSLQETGFSKENNDTNKLSYKEEKELRNQNRNRIQKLKREMSKIEPEIEKLKAETETLQKELDEKSEEGWSVLAEITGKMEEINNTIDEKEMRWMEIAEELEGIEVEV